MKKLLAPLFIPALILILFLPAFAQAPAFARPAPGTIGTPGEHVLKVKGEVARVTAQGIVLFPWDNCTVERVGNRYGSQEMGQPLFVAGAPADLVDGAKFEAVVYPAGRHTDGARTLHRYATTPELATSLLR